MMTATTQPNVKLKAALMRSGYKEYHVAKQAGIDPTMLSKIVHGHREAKPETQKAIARVLGKREEQLFRDNGNGDGR